MNILTVTLGALIIAYGAISIVLRHTHPAWFRKLGPMQDLWGKRAGYLVHFVGYSLLPIVLGGIFIYKGLSGGSLIGN